MYRETAGLVMYGQLGKDSILMKLGSLVEKMEHDSNQGNHNADSVSS